MNDLRNTIRAFLEPIQRRVMLMISRAVVSSINDAGGIQIVKVELLADETRDVERFGQYGLTSNPPDGSEAIVAFLGGNRAQGILIGIENRTARLKNLGKGDVALYTAEDNYAKLLKDDGEIHLKTGKMKLEGESDELLDLVKQISEKLNAVVENLSTDTTNTIFGPMKLNGFAFYATKKTEIEALIARLEAITA